MSISGQLERGAWYAVCYGLGISLKNKEKRHGQQSHF
jgi:hypothetical protein